MPLDLNADTSAKKSKKKATTKKADKVTVKPRKKKGSKPESPQEMVKRSREKDIPPLEGEPHPEYEGVMMYKHILDEMVVTAKDNHPKGQRIVVTAGPYEGHTGAIQEVVKMGAHAYGTKINGSRHVLGVHVDWDTDDVLPPAMFGLFKYAGGGDSTKTKSLKRRGLAKKKSSKKKTEPKEEPAEDPQANALARAKETFPIGTFVNLCGDHRQGIGAVVSKACIGKFRGSDHVIVDVLWENSPDAVKTECPAHLQTQAVGGLNVDENISFFWREWLRAAELIDSNYDFSEFYKGPELNEEVVQNLVKFHHDQKAKDQSFKVVNEKIGDPIVENCSGPKETAVVEKPKAPSVEVDKELLGLTDNAELTKVIGLPIEFSFDDFYKTLQELQDIIGLPVGHDPRLQAARIQQDHYWIQKFHAALKWAFSQAKTTFESWEAAQISDNWKEARKQYDQDVRRWKSKEIERPLAPDLSIIKYEIRGSKRHQLYKSGLNRFEYWDHLMSKLAVDGHSRKAFLVMNLHKADPQAQEALTGGSLDAEMTPDDDVDMNDMGDLMGEAAPPPDNGAGEPETPQTEAQVPDTHTEIDPGEAELYPWLAEHKPGKYACSECDAIVYHLDGKHYDIDRSLHDCKSAAEVAIEAEDDGFADLDVDLDDDLEGGAEETKTETASTKKPDSQSATTDAYPDESSEDDEFLDGLEL